LIFFYTFSRFYSLEKLYFFEKVVGWFFALEA